MSSGEENLPDPQKLVQSPQKDMSETVDFTVSTDDRFVEAGDANADAYATQFTQLPSQSDSSGIPKPDASMDSLPSYATQIPGFQVEGELGRGAFGVVFAARDEMLDRRVAIKMPLINDPHHRKQYIDEARKAVKLDHPSIVPIYQVGITKDNQPFVVQKLIEGKTLRHVLQESQQRVPIGQTISMMRQACLAVEAAHTAGVVHRDLKPENLLLESDGRLYVADFGLAITDDDEATDKGREIAGTPLYMSPEQFTGRTEWLDGRSDIWALGVILYELLSGKPPFSGKKLSELKDQIRHKDPRPIHQRNPEIPADFDLIFRKCCAKNVADRYASVRELIADLDQVCKKMPYLETMVWGSGAMSGTFESMGSRLGSMTHSTAVAPTLRGQSTIRNAGSAERTFMSTTANRPTYPLWSLLGPMLTTIVTLGLLVGSAWLFKFGPFASRVPGTPDSISRNVPAAPAQPDPPPMSIANHPSAVEGVPTVGVKEESLAPVAIPKPFRVSVNGNGTHDSIAKAIADSSDSETITILSGTYREVLVIDRPITLKAEGEVRLTSDHSACIEVRLPSDGRLFLEGITLDGQAPRRNTIDVFSGRLTMNQCQVFASTSQAYDCIKVHENAMLGARNCKFQSMEHAAIFGEKNSVIAIRDSEFRFPGNFETGMKRCGVQATNALGEIKNCSFVGPCLAGIDWKDTPEKSVLIEQCRFDNCHVAIQSNQCKKVIIQGVEGNPISIQHGLFGVNCVSSNVALNWVNIEGRADDSRVGLQATENSKIDINQLSIREFLCGILVKESSAKLEQLSVIRAPFAGLLVDDSQVEGFQLNLEEMQAFGMAVLSTKAKVHLDNLSISAVDRGDQTTTSAIYATSGEIEFGEAIVRNCLCGIFVDPTRVVIEDVGLPKKSTLSVLVKPSKKADLPLPNILGDRLTLTDCHQNWLIFNGIGSTRLGQLEGNLAADLKKPRLLTERGPQNERLELRKLGENSFVVEKFTK